MKFVWVPIAAALFSSHFVLADENQSTHIDNKNLSPKKVSKIYSDRDLDLVITKDDQCQNSELNSAVNTIGCDLDSDLDGIYDKNDQCPSTPARRDVNFLGCEADADDDGVVDANDRCPMTPLGTKVDESGCKFIGDLDSDGVLDNIDQCPETPNYVVVNQFGCQPQTAMLINIVFDTASWNIRSDQEPLLKEDLSTIKDLQDDEVVLIVGHTDSVGRESANMTLSWNRAASVKQYLVDNSDVQASQIYILGKGETSPVAENDSKAGRQQNRRIELEVMTQEALPENAALYPTQ
ncbi:MAG: OmpA family protein [Marinomonas sp.]|nr:MAG: OmpA family protein [Marinomonas sp.]